MRRSSSWAGPVLGVLMASGLAGCSGILDVEYPGRIPAEQVDDPSLAPVLVLSVVGDFECAFNNYAMATGAQSDEIEGTLSNFGTVVWSHRGISADNANYVSGPCEDTFGPGEAVIAPAGVEHGLVNAGSVSLLVLVVVTPPPPHV